MSEALDYIVYLLQPGLGNLASYLAAHVLLCLLPAFFLAGALTALLPKEAVARLLGRTTPKYISYPAAALAQSDNRVPLESHPPFLHEETNQ